MLPPNSAMDPKAQKRFSNDRTRAAQANVVGQAAQSAFHTNVNRSNSRMQQLMGTAHTGVQPSINQVATTSPTVASEGSQNGWGGGELMPPADPVETIQNNLDLENFLASPAIQQAMARSRLRRYFKRNDPSGVNTDVAADALSNLLNGT